MSHKIALIGFGTVGQGLCEILINKKDYLKEKYNFAWKVVAVSDPVKGSVYCPDGLNVEMLLKLANEETSLEEYDCKCDKAAPQFGWDALKTIRESNADTICELAFTNVETGQPAIDHCKAAFETGQNVVTSNKGPAAIDYTGMQSIAEKNNVKFMIEGTVVSGTPVLNLIDGPLAGCEISSIKGILNGTTNYILTRMEAGMAYTDALKKAQELGYAEADPTGDVEGFDAMAKVIILANVVMKAGITATEVEREGITGITTEMIDQAKSKNARWKLLGAIEKSTDGINASVKPEMITMTHPLAGIMDATNALTFTTDLLGDITIVGAGAGRIETGYSILTDILAIHRGNNKSN
ncbi:MAG: homoserine dehydrogenase [Candidatus Marinimicrobia bacterium]|nr:homoserine dehydrogenase [Candidatus Neomarinimicrobiota bacterium]